MLRIMTIIGSRPCYSFVGRDLQALAQEIPLIMRFWDAKLKVSETSANQRYFGKFRYGGKTAGHG